MGQTPSVHALVEASALCISLPNEREKLPVTHALPAKSHAERKTPFIVDRQRDMDIITAFFEGEKQTDILEYCLGYDKPGVPARAEHMMLIALKCGTLNQAPFHLLDIGLHILKRKESRNRLESPGPHSANILNNVAYHHLRMLDTAHFVNCLPDPNILEDNHFGATRFVDAVETKEFLEDTFGRHVKTKPTPTMYDPVRDEYVDKESREGEYEFGPIVLLHFDEPQLQPLEHFLGCQPSIWNNVVATIDAKTIAHEQGFNWRDEPRTLPQLTGDLGISYPDSTKTAADRAAYTLIDAVQMVMRPKFLLARESITSVVNVAMLHSQSLIPDWGREKFCTQCGRHDHRRRWCGLPQSEISCSKCFEARNYAAMNNHVVEVCPF